MATQEPMPQRVPRQYRTGTDPYAVYREMADKQAALPPPMGRHESSDVDIDGPAGAPGFANAPVHYQTPAGIQPFDVWDVYIGDWRIYAMVAFKYLARWHKKGSAKNDLQKAAHLLLEAFNHAPRVSEDFLDIEEVPLKPEDIVTAFELEGLIRDAAGDLLLAFTVPHPRTYLRAALSEVQEFFQAI